MADYENILKRGADFPVEVFIQDNLKKQVKVTEHFHDCFELLYFMCGTAEQTINTVSFIANKDDIILIRSGDIHSTKCIQDEDTKILVLKFMPSVIDAGYLSLTESKYLAAFHNYRITNEIRKLSQKSQSEIRTLLISILNEFVKKDKAYELRIKGYIFEVIALLVRYDVVYMPSTIVSKTDLERIDNVLRYMEANFNKELSLKSISKMLNMNYTYVSRYFKKITNRNFKEYLDYIRVCEAEQMILMNKEYIYEIADKCGFSSAEAFNRVYKRIRGYSPKDIKVKKC